jgi:putative sigma-54 modulation protein
MQIIVKGRHMDVTPALHDYAEEKVGKVARILDHQIMEAEVELYVERNPSIEDNQVAEMTMFTKRGPVIRAKEAATDMYAAIDLASDKLERQVRKYKGKLVDRHSGKHGNGREARERLAVPPPLPEDEEPEIVKTKQVAIKPMTAEEAILQLELLGHDFFVFTSAETEEVNVLYRRNDGDYGLIEPVMS